MCHKEPNLNPLLGEVFEERVDLVGLAAVHDEDDLVVEVAQLLVEHFPLLVHSFEENFIHPSRKDLGGDERRVRCENSEVFLGVPTVMKVGIDCFCLGDDCGDECFPIKADADDKGASPS